MSSTILEFMEKVLAIRNAQEKIISWGETMDLIDKGVKSEALREIFHAQDSSVNILADKNWIQWAYLVWQSDDQSKNAFQSIYKAMAAELTAERLNTIFKNGIADISTRELVIELRNRWWKDNGITPSDVLSEIDTLNFFGVAFDNWLAYLSFSNQAEYNRNPRVCELKYLILHYRMPQLLEILVYPTNSGNVRASEYLTIVSQVMLPRKIRPCEVVKAIASNDGVIPTFLNEVENETRFRFWFDYHLSFNERYPEYALSLVDMLTEAVGPARVAAMLLAAQKSTNKTVKNIGDTYLADQCKQWSRSSKSAHLVHDLISKDLAKNPWKLETYSLSELAGETSRKYSNYVYKRLSIRKMK
ncbi:uncharacterized protein PHALS_04241 [Plasmopara halstedii]|uniref:Uncharacterized protein n=1 Tax=Plasmopara halstedii TaxID=4781 RepID=A0A0P1B095_PLAHL|nr:uncharacterized protein PHALS_04241 [Plasmopara halstedii]CEG47358.1 hypothetical protein PHALS_04241 [Plasmopara halstedii]|eukprot:XP_024583727.1 hypothetical protein PHALS_04241 [Plasmopara halstedii]